MGFSSFFTVVLSLALTLRVQAVGMGSAAPYAVLGASTVTNTGLTKLNGELGVYPGTAITGFPPGILTGGTHSADATTKQAQLDAHAAYDTAAGLPYAPADDLTGQDLGGKTLVPSVYHFSSSVGVTGTLTLDAKGDSNAVWVFQIGSTITTASASAVKLINGAQACNVIWQVGSSATLGTGTNFAGNVVALASITATTGVTNAGGLYALTAAVTLDTNQISGQPNCANKPIALPATSSTITIPFVPITSSIAAIIPSSSAAPVVTSYTSGEATYVVYKTVTTCPATKTMTSGSHTTSSVYLTTSFVTVTSCRGGCPTKHSSTSTTSYTKSAPTTSSSIYTKSEPTKSSSIYTKSEPTKSSSITSYISQPATSACPANCKPVTSYIAYCSGRRYDSHWWR